MKKLLALVALTMMTTACAKEETPKEEIKDQGKLMTQEVDKSQHKLEFANNFGEEFEKAGIKLDLDQISYSSQTQDEELSQAIKKAIDYQEDFGPVKYLYNHVDLNGDGREEVFVYLLGQYVSGTGGNTALILEPSSYDLRQEFTLMNNPIIVMDQETNGYKDLLVYVAGGGAQAHFVELKYDGNKYPSNPSLVDDLVENVNIKGISIISDKLGENSQAILLK